MRDLVCFKDFVSEINAENGRLYKQSVLTKYNTDVVVKKFLRFAFDPFIQFGVGQKKLAKNLPYCNNAAVMSTLGLLEYLQLHNTGSDYDVAHAQTVINRISEMDTEAAALLTSIICKDLSIGVDSKTINKCMGNVISTFEVQLANKYFDKPDYVNGKEFAITEKLDGCRIIAIKHNSKINFYTRAGQEYTGLVDLEAEMQEFLPDNIALDGEITVYNYGSMKSKEAYKATTKIVRTDGEKHGVVMRVFDAMTADEWINQQCDKTYKQRRHMLGMMFHTHHTFDFFKVLPVLYLGSDVSKITELLQEAINQDQEGVMINIADAKYEWKRTNNLLKVKKMKDMDLRVIGVEEGEGRLKDTLGALKVHYKGNEVWVGSGFTDDQRHWIWEHRADMVGRIVSVQYFETTTNADGKESLRFPVFIDWRTDKTEADF